MIKLGDFITCSCGTAYTIGHKDGTPCPLCDKINKPGDPDPFFVCPRCGKPTCALYGKGEYPGSSWRCSLCVKAETEKIEDSELSELSELSLFLWIIFSLSSLFSHYRYR